MTSEQQANRPTEPRDYRCADGSWRPSRPEGLARVLAKAGYGARPRTESIVCGGRVTVDGTVELDPGRAVDGQSKICLDGEVLREAPRSYLAMHKPVGVECQQRRQAGRWIGDYLPADLPGLEPVGRLDWRSRGLLLITNDLWWSTQIAQNHDLPRRYEIQVDGRVTTLELDVIRAGLNLPGKGFFRPLKLRILAIEPESTRLDLSLKGGRLRQARAVFTMLRHEITAVVCTGIGPVDLDHLGAGVIRPLAPREINRLAEPLRNERP